jgi:hypothetical protein
VINPGSIRHSTKRSLKLGFGHALRCPTDKMLVDVMSWNCCSNGVYESPWFAQITPFTSLTKRAL